jgi:hypothetical protein
MLFNIRGVPTDLSITTVVLEYDRNISNNETDLIMWHCPVCATPTIQFGARLIAILPGLVPNKTPPVIAQCYKCKHKYLFYGIVTL